MKLTAQNLKRYGLERGAYNGANKRRFVLFDRVDAMHLHRYEYDTKAQRDHAAANRLVEKSRKDVTY